MLHSHRSARRNAPDRVSIGASSRRYIRTAAWPRKWGGTPSAPPCYSLAKRIGPTRISSEGQHQLQPVADPELCVDDRKPVAHRLLAQTQDFGDLTVRESGLEGADRLPLPMRQDAQESSGNAGPPTDTDSQPRSRTAP